MINDFKNQTPETIFHFLTLLGREADVFATEAAGICPTLAKDSAYIYIKDDELVIVLIDNVLKSTREIAEVEYCDPCEESKFQDVSTPEIAHCNVCRTSPVWKLFQALLSIRNLTKPFLSEPFNAYGVLITNSDIINYGELDIATFGGYDDISMTVMHRCFSFCDRWNVDRLPVNAAPSLPGAKCLRIYKRELSLTENEKEQKAFIDMLNSFLGNDSDDGEQDDIDTDDADDADDDLDSRIAACQSAEERRRLIVLRAKLAVRNAF